MIIWGNYGNWLDLDIFFVLNFGPCRDYFCLVENDWEVKNIIVIWHHSCTTYKVGTHLTKILFLVLGFSWVIFFLLFHVLHSFKHCQEQVRIINNDAWFHWMMDREVQWQSKTEWIWTKHKRRKECPREFNWGIKKRGGKYLKDPANIFNVVNMLIDV